MAVQGGEVGGRHSGGFGERAAVEHEEEGIEEEHEPRAAGVDDAGLGEDGELLGGLGEGVGGLGAGALDDGEEARGRAAAELAPWAAPSAAAQATVRMVPSTGRTTALRASSAAWVMASTRSVGADAVVAGGAHALAHAAEELGEDHAGVAAGAHEGAVADGLADLGEAGGAVGRWSSSATTASRVRAMLVPVSPSGTG